MAVKIINMKYEKMNSARVELCADTADELTTSLNGITFTFGSIAWIVTTGDLYGMNSSNEWVKQN